MFGSRHSVKALAALLPVIAGGLMACEGTYNRPRGSTVPIDNRDGRGSTIAGNTNTRPAPVVNNNTGNSTAKPAPAPAPKPAPAPAPAPARAEATTTAPMPSSGNVLYYPTGSRNTSALMVEKMAPSEVVANTQTEYQIKVTNLTNATLNNVVFTESIPAGFSMAGTNPQGAAAGNGGMAFNLGDLGPGQSKLISIKGAFNKAGSYTGCGSVTYAMGVCQAINVVAPSLALQKTAPAEVILCDAFPIKLVVTNNGTGTARNVVVKDPLPAGLRTTDGSTTFDWNVGNLASGQSATKEFMVKADKVGNYNNTASATAEGLNANSNATNTVVKAPTLTIDKKCPDRIRQGQNATFEIVVTNTGNAPSRNTVLRDPAPAGAQFVSASDGGALSGGAVVWNLGELAPGASVTRKVTMKPGAGTTNNQATVQGDCAAAVSDNCSISVQGVPDIGTGIEDDDGVVEVGQPHTFRFVVKNQGQVDLTNVKVVFKPESGLEYVSTNWAGGATNAAGTQTVAIGTLPIGATRTFSITYKGMKAGDLIIISETTSDQTRMVRNDEQVNYVN